MICPHCNKETKGIRLNGKVYCAFCGEVTKDPTELLEESYTKKLDKRKPKNNIIKSSRMRTDHNGFKILENEPDPIEEPELESPRDMKLSTKKPQISKDIEGSNPFIDKKDLNEMRENAKKRQALLNEYFRKGAEEISKKNSTTKKRKKKISNKYFLFIAIFLIILGFGFLVYYVNNYALNEEKIKTSIKEQANFEYAEPSYMTPGYSLSYLSSAEPTKVKYVYTHFEKDYQIQITAETTSNQNNDIYETYIKNKTAHYTSQIIKDVNLYTVDFNTIYFVKDGVNYTIFSDKLSQEELLKIAESIILTI